MVTFRMFKGRKKGVQGADASDPAAFAGDPRCERAWA